MDCSSSVGTAKTDHLAVDLAPTALSAWRSFRCPVWVVGSACASPAVNIRKNSESCAHPRRSRRTGLLNKAGHPAEKWRGRRQSRAWALTGAQTENLRGLVQRGGIHRKPMAILRKTQRVASGTRTAKPLTTGDLDSGVGRFGSSRGTLLRNVEWRICRRRILRAVNQAGEFEFASGYRAAGLPEDRERYVNPIL